MAVRHVVMWKLNGETKRERLRRAEELASALNALADIVPGIISLAAAPNGLGPDTNWDMVLVSEFSSEEALDAYSTHPSHLAVVEEIKASATERACVDARF